MFERIYRITAIILLVLVVALLGYGQFVNPTTPSTCNTAILQAGLITNTQATIISGMQSDYNTAVYHTDSVDNINKQIFIANEFEFNALQMIALQNSSLLEIAANCR